jgi:hypothetical protein
MKNKGGREDGKCLGFWVLAPIVVIVVLFSLKLAAILKTCISVAAPLQQIE